MSIIDEWERIKTADGSLSAAITDMNRSLNQNYTLSVFGRWRNGHRPLPDYVHRYMLRDVAPHVLREYADTVPNADAITDKLMPPLTGKPRNHN